MEHCDLGHDPEILVFILQPDVNHINLSHNNIYLLGAVKISAYFKGNPPVVLDNNKCNDDNKIAIIDNARIINMTPLAAILQASEALSDLSRIPLLRNTFRCP